MKSSSFFLKAIDPGVMLLNQIRNSQSTEPNQFQEIYKSNFKSEDNFNQRLMEFLPKFKLYNWRAKVLIAVILTQIINAYSLLQEKNFPQKSDLRNFIREFAENWL